MEAALDWWRAGFSVSRTRLSVAPRELNLADGWVFDWFDWSLSIVPVARGAPMIDQGNVVLDLAARKRAAVPGHPSAVEKQHGHPFALGGRLGLIAKGRLPQVHDAVHLKR